MSEIREFRELIGLSQEQFATMLQTSRAQISMVEAENRKLPNRYLSKLGIFQARFIHAQTITSDILLKEEIKATAEADALLNAAFIKASTQVNILRKQLQESNEKYIQALLNLKAARNLMSEMGQDINVKELQDLRLIERIALKSMEVYGLKSQMQLKLRLKQQEAILECEFE